MSLDGAFAGLAVSCLPSARINAHQFLEFPSEPDWCHACKVPFCESCVDTTNCWVNLWEQSLMLRGNGWLLQLQLRERKKMWQCDKRFFSVWPLTSCWIPTVTFHLLTCISLPKESAVEPSEIQRNLRVLHVTKRHFLNHIALFILRYSPQLNKQQFSSLQDSKFSNSDYPFHEKTVEFIFFFLGVFGGLISQQAAAKCKQHFQRAETFWMEKQVCTCSSPKAASLKFPSGTTRHRQVHIKGHYAWCKSFFFILLFKLTQHLSFSNVKENWKF